MGVCVYSGSMEYGIWSGGVCIGFVFGYRQAAAAGTHVRTSAVAGMTWLGRFLVTQRLSILESRPASS